MTCPDDLQAAVGKTLRCEFTTGGQPVDAVVTVTSVEDGLARYDVHTEARPVAKVLLDQKVAETLSAQADIPVDSSNCAGDLQPQVGNTVSCEVTGRFRKRRIRRHGHVGRRWAHQLLDRAGVTGGSPPLPSHEEREARSSWPARWITVLLVRIAALAAAVLLLQMSGTAAWDAHVLAGGVNSGLPPSST